MRQTYVVMCVYSNFRNDVPRVAQRYGHIAAHTRRRASVIVVFVVFCMHMYSFAGLIRRTPPPTFIDTAITDCHSDTTHYLPAQSSLGADILVYWIGKMVRTCAPGGSRTLDFLRARRAPYPLGQALRSMRQTCVCVYSNSRNDVPRVAQRYGTIAAHTRRHASVLIVFVVFACTCTVLPV